MRKERRKGEEKRGGERRTEGRKGPLPAAYVAPTVRCSVHYSTLAPPAQAGTPHCPETRYQATDLFWEKSATSHEKEELTKLKNETGLFLHLNLRFY